MSIKDNSTVLTLGDDLAIEAAKLHLSEKLASIDAFVYAAANKIHGQVLTGDLHFKGTKNVIFIE